MDITNNQLKAVQKKIKTMVIPTEGLEDIDVEELYDEIYDRYMYKLKGDHRIEHPRAIRTLKQTVTNQVFRIENAVATEKQGEEPEWTGLPDMDKRRGRSHIDSYKVNENEFLDTSKEALESILQFTNAKIAITPDEFAESLTRFFDTMLEQGQIPTVEKMGLALGYDTSTLNNLRNGSKGYEIASHISRAFQIIAAYDAEMATQGKVNPTVYIFRSKNFYGLRDDYNIVIPQSDVDKQLESEEDIRARLLKDIPSDDNEE